MRGLKLKISKTPKARLIRSLIIGFLFIIGVAAAFTSIRHSTQEGGTPITLRRSFMFNEGLWKALTKPQRMSVNKPRPSGKPRINGSLGLESPVDFKDYSIQVQNGDKDILLPLAALKVLPQSDFSTDFRCIEGWSEELHYVGTKFSDFLKYYDLGKKPDGEYYSFVGLETPDRKYYVSIDMESMLHDQTVLAYKLNGQELSIENGAPVRLIIPVKYGIKSLKRIGRIYFSDTQPPDYWAERGYDWYSGL